MVGGILLSTSPGIDEINLRGAGKDLPITGLAYVLAGLLLADLPVGLEHQGRALIDAAAEAQGYGRFLPVLTIACALTGAGILRGAGRIFWELGPDPGEEADAPSEEERETSDRPVWLMLMPVFVLLAADMLLGLLPVEAAIRQAAATFTGTAPLSKIVLDGAAWVAPPPAAAVNEAALAGSILGLCVALGFAALQLARGHFPHSLVRASDRLSGPVFRVLDRLHNGIVVDYVAWLLFGLVVLGGALAFG